MDDMSSIEIINIPLCKVRSAKSPGVYNNLVEILKAGGVNISFEIQNLITRGLNESSTPKELVNGILISKELCSNSRRIALPAHTRKLPFNDYVRSFC